MTLTGGDQDRSRGGALCGLLVGADQNQGPPGSNRRVDQADFHLMAEFHRVGTVWEKKGSTESPLFFSDVCSDNQKQFFAKMGETR